ncbi:hypothetical protein Pryu01_01267 [Paraliobacillus ryukyuensis]|uniref:Sporulation related protein n=1 Tax=Paraliobacillus ryukyuensis TaxID=200904 RepID=A0A366ECM9_9BACI|nr:SPOR domain-containing protein [Paraliobacillus ryukyuensis]RBO99499.1 sporulation related protein [Paraliobacillus ryukyuensis]
MDNKKKVIVKLNNRTLNKSNDSDETDASSQKWFHEQAASIDSQEEPDIYERRESTYTNVANKKNNQLKLTILTVIVAIIVGISFGFIVLKMFVEMKDPSINATNQQLTETEVSSDQVEEKSGQTTNDEIQQTITINAMSAYVVQAGVFSTAAQADEWKKKLSDAGYQAFSWNTDEGVRLFTNLFTTESEADQLVAAMSEKGLEGYAREWRTEEREASINANVEEWLGVFSSLWNTTVTSITDEQALYKEAEAWKAWLESAPKESPDSLHSFNKSAQNLLVALEEKQAVPTIHINLFEVWYYYSQL